MTKERAIKIGATYTGICLILSLSALAQGQTPLRASESAVQQFLEHPFWELLRMLGGLLGMALGAFGVISWYKISIHKSHINALAETVDIYENKIKAQELAILDEKKSKEAAAAICAAQEKALMELKARTDLTTVIGMMTDLVKNSDVRYNDGMKVIKASFEDIASANKELSKNLTAQYNRLESVSRRLGEIEVCIYKLCDHLHIHNEPEVYNPEKRKVSRD